MDLKQMPFDIAGMNLLKTIPLYDIQKHFGDHRRVTSDVGPIKFEYIASYNWLKPAEVARRQGKPRQPIMVVPGAPSIFQMWPGGAMEPDKEVAFADENRYFVPDYPLEPLFRAVLLEGHEPMALQTLDIVTDRYNLRKLYEFCKFRGTPDTRRPTPFQIKVERLGRRLVVFEQCSDVEYPKRHSPIYGRQFEELCSRPWSRLTKGTHFSILKYDLGDGLSCLVRCNADSAEWDSGDDGKETSPMDVKPKPIPDSNLMYISHGFRKYNFKYIELTTRSDESRYPDYVWDQLYFGRAENVYIGWHKEGFCSYPQLLTVDEVQKRMREKHIPPFGLMSLRILLRQLVDFIRQRPAGERYVLSFDGDAMALKLFQNVAQTPPDEGILPAKLRAQLEDSE